jgi:hypothetical protein
MTVEYDARGLTLTLTISVDADIRGNAVGAWGNCLCINSCRPAIFARNFLPIAQSWFREHDEACQVDRGDNVRRFHGVTPGWRGHFKRGQPKSQKGPPGSARGRKGPVPSFVSLALKQAAQQAQAREKAKKE